MRVRRFDIDQDFEAIKRWGKEWDGSDYDKDLLSPVGFILPEVCAYFVYETGTKQVFLENLITNPKAPKELKELGIKMVITETLKYCNEKGYKVARAVTNNEAVIERAIMHNAMAQRDATLLTLKFKK